MYLSASIIKEGYSLMHSVVDEIVSSEEHHSPIVKWVSVVVSWIFHLHCSQFIMPV